MLVPVEGVVTVDGQPLPNARVLFVPLTGRPSYGITDSDGKYRLRCTGETMGAVPGEHRVIITTVENDDNDASSVVKKKEMLPAVYNSKSTLTVSVDQRNRTHDFALNSK